MHELQYRMPLVRWTRLTTAHVPSEVAAMRLRKVVNCLLIPERDVLRCGIRVLKLETPDSISASLRSISCDKLAS